MKPLGRTIGFGVLAWLIPFAVAFLAFPLRESARPVFESVMAVTVTATAAILGLVHLRRVANARAREGLLVGIVWLLICIVIDAPLMLVGGPMKMSIGAYLGDIGLTYVSIPVVTWAIGAALAAGGRRAG